MKVRLAELVDAEQLRTIYNHEVTTSTATFDMVARSPEEQVAWLLDHEGAHPAIVALDPPSHDDRRGPVVGFASLSPYRPRPAYRTTVEDSIYVREDQRGRGVGKLLLSSLLELAGTHGFHAVIGRINGSQQASIALHRSCGFETVGIEREVGRKFGRWQDVAVMERLL